MPLFGVGLWAIWTQFFPPRDPPITEKTLPSQAGKCFIVTGGSSGIGYELARILYRAGGNVYILSRSTKNMAAAIENMKSDSHVGATEQLGRLDYIEMDLEDLASVQKAAKEYVSRESRLDVLFNNAGVASVPAEYKTKQGLEYHLGVNSVAHVLLEKLLKPIMTETAKSNPKDSVRVVWPASILCELTAPKGGIRIRDLDKPSTDINEHYAASKVANWFAASEYSRRSGRDTGILSIAVNPGSYVTNVWRTTPGYLYYPFLPMLGKPIDGAYTYLWAGFSDEVTMDDAVVGRYGTCIGRWYPGSQREDLLLALKNTDEGGTGEAKAYFEWCEAKIAPFLEL